MKKFICLLALVVSFNAAQAQFDLILNTLENLTGEFSGSGYVNTIENLQAAQHALDLIDQSRCLIDDMNLGMEFYDDEVGFNCMEDLQFDLLRAELDNSAIVIADQLYGNATQVLNIFTGIIGGEGDKSVTSSVNKGLVQDAIDNAIETLIQLMQRKAQMEQERKRWEVMQHDINKIEIMFESLVATPMLANANLSRLQNDGQRELDGAQGLIELGIQILTILTFIGMGYTILKDEQMKISHLIGLVSALVALGVANALI